ncbi:MAG: hypothetical protein ACLTMH_17655 [Faecalimonas umbilicata]|uniref:hypothetical protein n=1 Tax=Faecalimonas umbilicata TaxID=1912855 RepID=UPI00399559A5
MESIINKLTEIESAASAIAEHAELQKSGLDKEYEEKRKQFDLELEQKPRLSFRRSGNLWKQIPSLF